MRDPTTASCRQTRSSPVASGNVVALLILLGFQPGDRAGHLPHLVRLGVAILPRWMFTRGSPCQGVLQTLCEVPGTHVSSKRPALDALSAAEKAAVLDELLTARPDLRETAEAHATRLMKDAGRSAASPPACRANIVGMGG